MSFHGDRGSVFGGIVVVLLLVGGLVVCGLKQTAQLGQNRNVAETELRRWAASLDIPIHAGVCNDADSDGDGYVSCTYKIEGEPVGTTHQVECAAAWNFQHGCREPKIHVPATSTSVQVETRSRR